MNMYKSIVAAVELNDIEDAQIIKRAQSIAKINQSKLYLVHAVEHISTYGAAIAYPAIMDVEDELVKEHQQKLAALGQLYAIPPDQLYLEVGSPSVIIQDKAKLLQADLIVLGNHGRHGLALLLGSTADSLVHHAPCDVLVVKLIKSD